MKILHIPFGYFPGVRGGTEVYVSALCRELKKLNCEPYVAAPGNEVADYSHDDIPVYRYTVESELSKDQRAGAGDQHAASQVGDLLDQIHPDIVHMHALTAGVSPLTVEEAKKRSIPVVFTYHTPTVTCMNGTLMRENYQVCSGEMNSFTCAQCSLSALGMPRQLSKFAADVPAAFGRFAAVAGIGGKAETVLRHREMVNLRHRYVRKAFADFDHVIVLCEWTEKLLKLNKLGTGKTSLIPHGLPHDSQEGLPEQRAVPDRFSENDPLRLLYLGRIAPEKGLDIIIEAVSRLPRDFAVTLDLFGLVENESYAEKLSQMTALSGRVKIHRPVPTREVLAILRDCHALVVPSCWMETGPFVVLEAFETGTPVLGSAVGGIAEKITHGVNGLLVDSFRSSEAWKAAITSIYENPKTIREMREKISFPCRFEDVAKAHMAIYQDRVCSAGV